MLVDAICPMYKTLPCYMLVAKASGHHNGVLVWNTTCTPTVVAHHKPSPVWKEDNENKLIKMIRGPKKEQFFNKSTWQNLYTVWNIIAVTITATKHDNGVRARVWRPGCV